MLLIGRGEGSDILLLDASVSRRHARVYGSDDNYHITNLSAGGITINGQPAKTARLKHGDVIQIGKRKLVFSRDLKQADEEIVDFLDDSEEIELLTDEAVVDLSDWEDDSAFERQQ